MKKNSKNGFLASLAVILGVTLLFTLILRDTATTHAAMKSQATRTLAQAGKSLPENEAVAYINSAPYRDGLYQGKLTRERGEAARISAGRWTAEANQAAFSDGYQQGFAAMSDAIAAK
jgi:hypothetical protein